MDVVVLPIHEALPEFKEQKKLQVVKYWMSKLRTVVEIARFNLLALSVMACFTLLDADPWAAPESGPLLDSLVRSAEQGNARAQSLLGDLYRFGKSLPQDFDAAAHWYRKAAEQGDAAGQFGLGELCMYGSKRDYKAAIHWYRKAAEQGHAAAQLRLGHVFELGPDAPPDYEAAVRWYRKAAEQGLPEAQFAMGASYYVGDGVDRDYRVAARWFRKAAEQGHGLAQRQLGLMHYSGEGVLQDYVAAHMWLNLATARLSGPGGRAAAARLREEVSERMTPEQIAEAQRLAREWTRRFGADIQGD